MKPSRLLLIWLAVLLAIGIVPGTLRALDMAVPSSLFSINWGLLLALLTLAILDAIRLKRLPSPAYSDKCPVAWPSAVGAKCDWKSSTTFPYR